MVMSVIELAGRITLVGIPDTKRAAALQQQHPTLVIPPVTTDSQPGECAECGTTVWLNRRQVQIHGEVQVICWDCAHDRVACERYTALDRRLPDRGADLRTR